MKPELELESTLVLEEEGDGLVGLFFVMMVDIL